MVTAHDLVRHYPAIHHMYYIGIEFGDGAADLAPQPIVRHGTLSSPIDKQNPHLQTNRAQALDLFLHKDTPAWERRRRVNICYGQDSHTVGMGTPIYLAVSISTRRKGRGVFVQEQ